MLPAWLSLAHSVSAAHPDRIEPSFTRNVADYEGEPVKHAKLIACTDAARQLLADVRAWLKENLPAGKCTCGFPALLAVIGEPVQGGEGVG